MSRNSFDFSVPQTTHNLSIEELQRRIQDLEQQLIVEHVRNEQLISLNEFSHQLENLLDLPVEAQLAANTLAGAFKCSLAMVLVNNPSEQRLVLMSAAGPDATNLSPNYRHSLTRGLVGRSIRVRRPLINLEGGSLSEPVEIGSVIYPSQLVFPMMLKGYLEGAIILVDREQNAFDPEDIPYVEALGSRLMVAWENDRNRQTLADLIESAASLSATQNSEQLLDRVAEIARRTTKSSYSLVAIREELDWIIGTSGKAPLMFPGTKTGLTGMLDEVYRSRSPLRVRDIRKDSRTAALSVDSAEFRSLLAVPILLESALSGVILVFGKKTNAAFTEQDEFMLNLLGTHAAVSIERCFLDQELRSTLKTTQLLYDLSIRIAESDDLVTAAQVIARTAFRLFQATSCGLVLHSQKGQMEASVIFPTDDPSVHHPKDMIKQSMSTRQIIYQAGNEGGSRVAIPIQTPRRCYGSLWLELSDSLQNSPRPVEEIRIFINQASVALERSILLSETRQQANQITKAYNQLEESYDQTLLALMNALDARDHETEKHTLRVSQISSTIGKACGLNANELKALERGSLLHDIGKIGISDSILLKRGKLDKTEWDLMQKHPAIGAEIIRSIPSLSDALVVVANHHERWDGSGYPFHLKEDQIPLLARIFIVADVFDALTSDRVYRERISEQEAMDYIKSQSGILFDPEIVCVLEKVLPSITGKI
ncbi:MAG: GAF domain-containing protein [Anaerolineae bacterium]|nr:GAF domain-containing protein [Anaerolineae bacterium]